MSREEKSWLKTLVALALALAFAMGWWAALRWSEYHQLISSFKRWLAPPSPRPHRSLEPRDAPLASSRSARELLDASSRRGEQPASSDGGLAASSPTASRPSPGPASRRPGSGSIPTQHLIQLGRRVLHASKAVPTCERGEQLYPRWSPRGRYLAFVRKTEQKQIAYIYDAQSHKVRLASSLDSPFKERLKGYLESPLTWLPRTGQKGRPGFVYSSNRGHKWMRVYNHKGQQFRFSRHRRGHDGDLHWSAMSALLAFVSTRGGNAELYHAPGFSWSPDHTRVAKTPTFHESFPRWSPVKSGLLAFVRSTLRYRGARIYLHQLSQGHPPRRLTREAGHRGRFRELAPSWSPDGTHIAYAGLTPKGSKELHLVEAKAGSRPLRLAKNLLSIHAEARSWAPARRSGRKSRQLLFFLQQNPAQLSLRRLLLLHPRSGLYRQIVTPQPNPSQLSVSWDPQGHHWRIAYAAPHRPTPNHSQRSCLFFADVYARL